MEEAVNILLTEEPFPSDTPVNNYEVQHPDPDVPKGQSWTEARPAWSQVPENPGAVDGRLDSLRGWLVKNHIQQPNRLQQKMVAFWHNHLPTEAGFIGTAKMSFQYFRMLWTNAYENFKDLIYELTIDPAMLVYLNGTANNKDEPDENYARELQELFCIGKGPNALFTESDVQQAARVLTGWGVDWDAVVAVGEAKSRFFDFNHTTSDKRFSSFYGNKVIRGRGGANGARELDELIDMVVEHPECARFICRKLYRFFVHNDITPDLETELIEPLAELFIQSGYVIKPVLHSLFTSEQFYRDDIIGAMIKSPLDVMAGTWKTLQVSYPDEGDPIDEDYWTHLLMIVSMDEMGYYVANPPSVSGWPAYYQIPSYDKLWITTFTLISRIIVTDALLYDGFWTPTRRIPWDFLSFTASLDQPHDINKLIEEVLSLLLAVDVSNDFRQQIKDILLSGQATDSYWTGAWGDYISNPQNHTYRSIVESRLRFFYQVIFQSPEFQLM